MKNQNELYLVLNKQWFNEILEGKKTEEYRPFTDHYIKRLCIIDEKGEIADIRMYDTIKFQLGYKKDAPQMIVEVKDVILEVDDTVDMDNGDLLTVDNCNFTIVLGKILSKVNC